MHTLMLRTDFIAQHFLIGKDFGAENFKHSHRYSLELEIISLELDQYNYLVDIIAVRQKLEQLASHFNDKTLNELPEFLDQNPSIELFSKILWTKCHDNFCLPKNCQILVRLWEDDIAQASYRELTKCE
jgi:6-pyruvoyltetrahydropterin/6-carboxytetrahydropterin synthase